MPVQPIYVNKPQTRRIAKAMTHRYGLRRRRAGIILAAAAVRAPSIHAKVGLVAAGALTYASGKRAQLKARKVAYGFVKRGGLAPRVTYTSTKYGATKFSKRRVGSATTSQYHVQMASKREVRKQEYTSMFKRSTTNHRLNQTRRDLQKKSTYSKMTRSQAARKAALARWQGH